MIISTSHKFVYCAVPKVASRALRTTFEPLADEALMKKLFKSTRNEHGMMPFREPAGVKKRMEKAGVDPSGFFWFGFVRNPWDRAVSRYKFEHERAQLPKPYKGVSKNSVKYHKSMIGLSWDEYIRNAPYFPQSRWLRDEKGIVVDRIYRMEEMGSAFGEISAYIGLDLPLPAVRGATKRSRDYTQYYESADQINAVARYFAEDVLLGGYSYGGVQGESFDIKKIV
jgi:hypothetical protein